MPSTHLSLYYHIVFSTKDRRRLIAEPWRLELHAYMGGIIRNISGVAVSIGGTGDHVHVLLGLTATHQLADAVREMKRGSSAWIHQHGVRKFAWQEGYGAFTVSASQSDRVRKYIVDQVEHHRDEDVRRGICGFVEVERCGL